VNLILFGPPGSGKGTQSKFIQSQYQLPKLSTGEQIRTAIRENTEIGKLVKNTVEQGNFISDQLATKMISHAFRSGQFSKGFILDGFPRTLNQVKSLDKILEENNISLDFVIQLVVSDEAIIKRISGRFICKSCNENYNEFFRKTKVDGICDKCSSKQFVKRGDDRVDVIKKRLNAYNSETAPLIPYYKKIGILREIDGMESIKNVKNNIENLLKSA